MIDYEIPLKDPNEFVDTNMLSDLNDKFCLTKEDDMFDQDILKQYTTCIQNAKSKEFNASSLQTESSQKQ